jgi:ribosomal protein S18
MIGYNNQKNNIKLATKESKYSIYETEFVGDTEVCRSFISNIISIIPDKNTGTTCH